MYINKFFIILSCLIINPSAANAHSFFSKEGFYDGISHPVLGLDHFLAMISVGILSAQIGGRAIWTSLNFRNHNDNWSFIWFFINCTRIFFCRNWNNFVCNSFRVCTVYKQKFLEINFNFCRNFWFISWNCSRIRNSSCLYSNLIYPRFYMWDFISYIWEY